MRRAAEGTVCALSSVVKRIPTRRAIAILSAVFVIDSEMRTMIVLANGEARKCLALPPGSVAPARLQPSSKARIFTKLLLSHRTFHPPCYLSCRNHDPFAHVSVASLTSRPDAFARNARVSGDVVSIPILSRVP